MGTWVLNGTTVKLVDNTNTVAIGADTTTADRKLEVLGGPARLAVEDLGGDGLVLARDLGTEYFRYDEAGRQLVGDATGETYRIGQRLTLRLAEANPVSGSLRFELPEGSYGGPAPGVRRARTRGGKRGRPANIRHQGRGRR